MKNENDALTEIIALRATKQEQDFIRKHLKRKVFSEMMRRELKKSIQMIEINLNNNIKNNKNN